MTGSVDPDYLCAAEISRRAGGLLGVSEADAFDALTLVPENLLALLQSPEGWGTLARMIASDLGADLPAFQPTVH
jgi:hypothetical protein